MVNRLEFTKKVKREIFLRAGGPGAVRCEGCRQLLGGKPFEYDHILECWEMEDVQHELRPPLTADDGKLLGRDCCHKPKSAKKSGERAHVYRLIDKAAKASGPKRGGFSQRYKRRLDGTVVDRETGEIVKRGS